MSTSMSTSVSSFSKALALGEIHSDLVLPYPLPSDEHARQIRGLIRSFWDYARANLDSRRIDREGWIDDHVFTDLGELGLMGLYVPTAYGGQGLPQTGYCRVFEAIGTFDGSLSVALGVHQSIGMKGIVMFGSDAQKERFLPDLAAGRKLAAFALTEPEAGSDAYHVRSRAVRQPDGSWVLNGCKRYIGNGSRADVIVTFARAEVGGRDRHIALILQKGMEGLEVGERYDTMGLRGNDLRRLSFHDVRVPAENVLGEPGEGFHVAMNVLNNGRLSLGTGSVGLAKKLLDLTIAHVTERKQFGHPLADFDMVEDKVGWMVSYLFGLESLVYLTTGLVDAGVPDYSVESAMAKVIGTEFTWYAANRALQLGGGEAYMRDAPYEQILRDIRIFPIFEGANDVLRSFVALSVLQPLGEQLRELADFDLRDPLRTAGAWTEYIVGRARREVRPDQLTGAHDELSELAGRVSEQVAHLREACESVLRRYGRKITDHGMAHKRLSQALSDIYAQIAVLSRVTSIFAEQGVEASGQERYIAQTFCRRADWRVHRALDRLGRNDDERMHSIARLAYKRGAYGYALFED
jgi:acyl-CoA dehydrogenase family protein 9